MAAISPVAQKLYEATKGGKLENVQAVFAADKDGEADLSCTGKDVQSYGWNALHWAAFHNDAQMIREILSRNGNYIHVDDKTAAGWGSSFFVKVGREKETALDIANRRGNRDAASALLDYGAVDKRLGSVSSEVALEVRWCNARLPGSEHIVCSILSREVYSNLPQTQGLWECLRTSNDYNNSGAGYFGALYVNHQAKIVVIAHRGTVGFVNLPTDMGLVAQEPTLAHLYAALFVRNLQKTYKINKETSDVAAASAAASRDVVDITRAVLLESICSVALQNKAVHDSKEIAADGMDLQKYRVIHTGHSLGGAHAQFFALFQPKVTAITYDAPPVRPLLTKCKMRALGGEKYELAETAVLEAGKRALVWFGSKNVINGFSWRADIAEVHFGKFFMFDRFRTDSIGNFVAKQFKNWQDSAKDLSAFLRLISAATLKVWEVQQAHSIDIICIKMTHLGEYMAAPEKFNTEQLSGLELTFPGVTDRIKKPDLATEDVGPAAGPASARP